MSHPILPRDRGGDDRESGPRRHRTPARNLHVRPIVWYKKFTAHRLADIRWAADGVAYNRAIQEASNPMTLAVAPSGRVFKKLGAKDAPAPQTCPP